jgi:ABC-type antimicrobial peptide transport system permease subunit
MLKDLCRAGIEGMTDMSGSNRRQMYVDVISSIISLMIAILIVAFVGKWLWNNSVAELFTFTRPVRSVWQIIALMLLISLMK